MEKKIESLVIFYTLTSDNEQLITEDKQEIIDWISNNEWTEFNLISDVLSVSEFMDLILKDMPKL